MVFECFCISSLAISTREQAQEEVVAAVTKDRR